MGVKYETHEVKISELVGNYIASLPDKEQWKILAIDLITDVVVLKREVKEEDVEVKQE